MPYFSKRRMLRRMVRILQLRDRVDSVGRGLALGIFLGITVPWGAQMIVAFFLAWLFGFNRLVAVVATNITNFATVVPAYLASYYLGRLILWDGRPMPHPSVFAKAARHPHELVELVKQLGPPFLVGNFVLGVVCAAIVYLLFTRLVNHYHRRHRRGAPDPVPPSQPAE